MKYFFAETILLCVTFRCIELKIHYNTYPDHISKSTQYEPKVLRKSCLLKPDMGPCRGNIPMYYFDPEILNCTKFHWGGCMGNGNRYDTKDECKDTCLSKPNEKPKRPRYCALSFDYGYCFGAVKRWYYDHLWQVCKETIYSGCGGNKNNFYSIEQCDSVCRLALGPLPRKGKKKGGPKKVLIVDPPNTTPNRGKDQSITEITTPGTGNNQSDSLKTTRKKGKVTVTESGITIYGDGEVYINDKGVTNRPWPTAW